MGTLVCRKTASVSGPITGHSGPDDSLLGVGTLQGSQRPWSRPLVARSTPPRVVTVPSLDQMSLPAEPVVQSEGPAFKSWGQSWGLGG